MQKNVIVIAGPTASGKSRLAIDVALAVEGVIINADSMQVYKNTPIISACPTPEDKALVEHKIYEIWEADVNGSVVDWLDLAVEEIKKAWGKGKIPIIVGGTGLYIDNLINGTTPIPPTKAEAKLKVQKMLSECGINELHKCLSEVDGKTAERLSPNDTTRICRALEVFYDTGKSLAEWHNLPMIKKIPEAIFYVMKIVPDKKELDERCFGRFQKMVELGAVQEVEALQKQNLNRNLPAMRALGVPELMEYLEQKCSLEEAVDAAKLHTRQYAKRQRTWFNNKLKADIIINQCYLGQEEILKNVIYDVKKAL